MLQAKNSRSSLLMAIFMGVMLISGSFGVYYLVKNYSNSSMQAQVEVDWKLYGKMDYVTGYVPDELQKLNGTLIKSPGFMVPLEDNLKKTTQFLLVPNPQACIHVPPPPPNQMVLVNVKEGVEVSFGPIWVHGNLSIKTNRTQYGDVSFSIDGIFVEPYMDSMTTE